MYQTYRIIIEPDKKGFHGYVPALKGCHTWAKTIEETKTFLQEAMEVYVESLLVDGQSIPEDKSFESFQTVSVRNNPQKHPVSL